MNIKNFNLGGRKQLQADILKYIYLNFAIWLVTKDEAFLLPTTKPKSTEIAIKRFIWILEAKSLRGKVSMDHETFYKD